MTRDILRRCRFSPYGKGYGPTFTLTMWEEYGFLGGYYGLGCKVGYKLTMTSCGRSVTLFEGDDFRPSPLVATDSDATVAALMGFLTLRPGDTDSEYFDKYTPMQLAYCTNHAETLGIEVMMRFGEDN